MDTLRQLNSKCGELIYASAIIDSYMTFRALMYIVEVGKLLIAMSDCDYHVSGTSNL